jgi:hypothetical protein
MTAGDTAYPGGSGATGATTPLVRPTSDVPATAMARNQRFTDATFSAPTRPHTLEAWPALRQRATRRGLDRQDTCRHRRHPAYRMPAPPP